MIVSSHRCRALALAVVATVLAGCSGASSGPSSPGTQGSTAGAVQPTLRSSVYPLTIDNCGLKVTFDEPPSRVLILSGNSLAEVESFILLGLENRVYANAQASAVSDDATMAAKIAAVPTRDLTLNSNFDVPEEQVLRLNPDLVVSAWSGGFDPASGFASRERLTNGGVNTLVNPVNCARGKPSPSAAERAALAGTSVRSSFEFLTLLGQVFDVQDRAAQLVAEQTARIDGVTAKVKDRPRKKVLVVYPGTTTPADPDVPSVLAGGVYDEVVRLAGGTNVFEGRSPDQLRALSAAQLAATDVDLLVVGSLSAEANPADDAAALFAANPRWAASRNKAFLRVSDGLQPGPLNALMVDKLARALHPEAF